MKNLLGVALVALLCVSGAKEAPAQTVINNICDLRNVNSNSSANYALGQDIDASNFTCNAGVSFNFAPITNFSGSLNGQGHTVQNLTISTSGSAGLFAYIAIGATVQNLHLANATIIGTGDTGAVAGYSDGTISEVTAGGIVTGGNSSTLVERR